MYPDLSELDADERCEVPGMSIGGKPAYFYSAFNRKTVAGEITRMFHDEIPPSPTLPEDPGPPWKVLEKP